jgi:hypothetical protein
VSNKLKAMKQTALMVALVTGVPIIIGMFFTAEVAGWIILSLFFAVFVWATYCFNLAFIEMKDLIKSKDGNS